MSTLMQFPDLINGTFEAGGAIINVTNVLAIRRDRMVRGVHWSPWAVFSAWGIWNLYYYPHLNQWLSFTGGLAIVAVNMTWLGHYIYYEFGRRKETTQGSATESPVCTCPSA